MVVLRHALHKLQACKVTSKWRRGPMSMGFYNRRGQVLYIFVQNFIKIRAADEKLLQIESRPVVYTAFIAVYEMSS